jgi:uncharacterized protein (DUF433 family)
MEKQYVEKNKFGYRVAGSRVSLDSIVYAYREGKSPEMIIQMFDTLTLEQVYGAIAFYLANREEIDAYIEQGERDYEAKRQAARDADPGFYQKIKEARERLQPA